MELLTQDEAYKIYRCLLLEFEELVRNSTVTDREMFMFNNDIMEFIYYYNAARSVLVGKGLDMPELVKGLKIIIH